MTTPPTDGLPEGVASRTIDTDGVLRYRDAQGRWHNPAGPAVIHPDRATYWLITGDDPANQSDEWFEYRAWWVHGRRHRTDGLASEYCDGTGYYWVDGHKLSENEFYQRYPSGQEKQTTDDQP